MSVRCSFDAKIGVSQRDDVREPRLGRAREMLITTRLTPHRHRFRRASP
jgi:transcriptional regulator GlxA family with amidase domain